MVARDDRLSFSERFTKSRMRKLGQTLSGTTPFRAPLILVDKGSHNGNRIWNIQQGWQTELAVNGRGEEHVVEIGDSSSGYKLYLGFAEEWRTRSASLIFSENRLRFYIRNPGDETIGPPAFRLEWKERDEEGGDYIFPGKGAAHPHWQFGEELGMSPLPAVDDRAEEIAQELMAEPIDSTNLLEPTLSGEHLTPSPLDGRTRALFKRIHFPAKAGWATSIWDPHSDPQGADIHAVSPRSCEELDSWIISAIRYVQNEFGKYIS